MGAQMKYQVGLVSLSDRGREQVESLAGRFTTIAIDAIYSSPLPRALETAERIQEVTKKELIVDDILRELKRPTAVTGKDFTDPGVLQIKKELRKHAHDQSWHHSDEENFYDIRERIKQALAYLEAVPYESIAVVSHAVLMKVFALVMIMGPEATASEYHAFYDRLRITQTGITFFERGSSGWLLMTWNDYAHLGEDTTESFYK